MIPHWIEIAWAVAIVVAGCGVNYILVVRRVQRTLAESQRDTDRRIAALTEAVLSRAASTAESATEVLMPAEIEPAPGAPVADTRPEVVLLAAMGEPIAEEEIPSQIQAAIAAAVIASFGNHARVRFARRVPSSNVVSPWTQQGRVIVQSSHNLRTQGSR